MPNVDWSGDEVAAEGTYVFEIEHAELKIGATSGNEYISARLRCVDVHDIVVFENLSFSPKAKGVLKQKLRALGLEGRSPVEPGDLIGRRIKAAVKRETGNDGEVRLVVDISAKGSSAGYFSNGANGPKPAATGPRPAAQGSMEDLESDIPF